MLKKILSIVAGIAGGVYSSPANPESIDPNAILYTVPTISNDIPEVEVTAAKPIKGTVVFHEDDWRQVEFLKSGQIPEIKRILSEYKQFESQNRTAYGWKNVYVRDFKKEIALPGKQSVDQIESILRANRGSELYLTSADVFGKVKSGFTISIGGNIDLYGTATEAGITVLGAAVGQNPDDANLTEAFASLNKIFGLVLVDWKSQTILLSKNKSGKIEVWKP